MTTIISRYNRTFALLSVLTFIVSSTVFSFGLIFYKLGVTEFNLSPSFVFLLVGIAIIFDFVVVDLIKKNSPDKTIWLQKYYDVWFVRYTFAFLYSSLAFFMIDGLLTESYSAKITLVSLIFSILFTIYALVKAREVAIIFVVLASIYFVVVGLAQIPISIAIIVAALIIGIAIHKQ